jgi:beta-galactosidase
VYPGWFDKWGGKHNMRATSAVVFTLEKTLQLNGSLVFYLYFGGTNFGFTNGASITTSYDYDAQLSEIGDMTWKYQQTLATIKKYRPTRTLDVKNRTKKSYGEVHFTTGCTINEGLNVLTYNSTRYDVPIAMEELNVGYGFTLYKTKTSGGKLRCPTIADRGNILVEGKRIAIQTLGKEAEVEIPAGELDILVENIGRSNSGHDHIKGLTATPTLNGVEIKDWTSIGLETEMVHKLPFGTKLPERVPGFYYGTFNVDEVGDTFLNPKGWTRGFVWINGFNIGRYWTIGPQLTLYIPSGLLKKGINEVIVLELEHLEDVSGKMTLDDVHQIDI